ncbi:unnamed protein product [Vitrella brassicaformis CCMP3155]|uniref:Uncharacterized protein n=1 Tax=Vitrella brassicaformis (strain CCMP3155) TaxID=1169540 RepID=A0A0G4F602_VITBC|nr:unnamed protein product [Vitrella brassicaformis CCMP3155]|eukprot:CEM07802.1 unnamed protein product [Vitrella brassicaformis CCMP3155]
MRRYASITATTCAAIAGREHARHVASGGAQSARYSATTVTSPSAPAAVLRNAAFAIRRVACDSVRIEHRPGHQPCQEVFCNDCAPRGRRCQECHDILREVHEAWGIPFYSDDNDSDSEGEYRFSFEEVSD